MDFINEKDGNRKVKLISCKKCGREWTVRKDREHSGFCRKCKVSGEKNPMYGKEAHNKGYEKYGMSYTKYRWIKAKKEVVSMMGNQCVSCKEINMPIYCYEVHHKKPETKIFSVLSKLTAWWNPKIRPLIENEIKKCDLICKNCHAILHYGNDRGEEN